jgi:hypothetical protein
MEQLGAAKPQDVGMDIATNKLGMQVISSLLCHGQRGCSNYSCGLAVVAEVNTREKKPLVNLPPMHLEHQRWWKANRIHHVHDQAHQWTPILLAVLAATTALNKRFHFVPFSEPTDSTTFRPAMRFGIWLPWTASPSNRHICSIADAENAGGGLLVGFDINARVQSAARVC